MLLKGANGGARVSPIGTMAMKTAITIIADLVRSLVLSGLAAVSLLVLLAAAWVTTGYCLWRLWRRVRR